MKKDLVTHHSDVLNKDMDLVVYGETGHPVIGFAQAGAPCTNLEDCGMVDALAKDIDAGTIQLFCVSNVDDQTWLAKGEDNEHRAELQEAYYRYVTEEVVPFVQKRNGSKRLPLALGVDLGATHAAIFALRRPDLFQGCMALSGVYDSDFYFDGWMNGTLYENSPAAFLTNMPADHPYVSLYARRQLLFCTGQGLYEEACLRTQRVLDTAFARLGVDTWCDYWGEDVAHDWAWWNKQIVYFLPYVIEDIEKMAAEDAATVADKPAVKKVAAKKPAAKKTTAKKPATKKAAATKTTAAAEAKAVKAESAKAEPAKAEAPKTAAAKPAAAKTAAAKTTATKTTATKVTASKVTAAKTTASAAVKPTAKAAATKAKAAAAVKAEPVEKPVAKAATAAKAEPATKVTSSKVKPAAKPAAVTKSPAAKTAAAKSTTAATKSAAKASATTTAKAASAVKPAAAASKAETATAVAKPAVAKAATAKVAATKTTAAVKATTAEVTSAKTAAKSAAAAKPASAKATTAKKTTTRKSASSK